MEQSKINIITEGLRDASDDLRRSETVKLGYTKELARLALCELGDTAALLFEIGAELSPIADTAVSQVKKLMHEGENGADFARFISELYEKKYGALPSYTAEKELVPHSAAFVSGSGADAAYDIFKHRLGLSPIHSERISSTCDAVLDGDAGYCILPLKSGRDGRLRSFYRMMDVYDLKISAACVAGSDENMTRYALCGRSHKPIFDKPTHIEISSPATGAEALAVAASAKRLGHELTELSSTPSEHGGEVYSFTFELRGDYRPFILYMNIFHPRYTLTGLYSVLA